MHDLVVLNQETNQPMTTSLTVAETFGKNHRDILRAIQMLECSYDFLERNFALYSYRPPGAKRDFPMYEITRDGFTFLAMGFTGSKAAEFKERYISAFNQMEEELRNKPTFQVPQTFKDALLLAAHQQEQIELLEHKVTEDAPKVSGR